MNLKVMEGKFLDYLEDKLSPAERLAFEDALSQDAALKSSFAQYCALMRVESTLAQQSNALHPSFTAQAMSKIEETDEGFFRRFAMLLSINRRAALAALTTCATLVLVLRLAHFPALEVPRQEDNSPKPIIGFPIQEIRPESNADIRDRSAGRSAAQPSVGKIEAESKETGLVVPKVANEANTRPPIWVDDLLGLPRDRSRESSKQNKATATLRMKDENGQDQTYSLQNGVLAGASREAELRRAPMIASQPALAEKAPASRPVIPAPSELSSVPPQQHQQWQTGEDYRAVGENVPTLVSNNPVSTFSIDVDTASYANARRFIRSGTLPPPESVRIEEFLNYFDYDYPSQAERPFTLSYEAGPSPLEPGKVLLKLGIKARDAQISTKPWNLVFLIDISGSMADPMKLNLIKQSLPMLVERMRSSDRLAIVTYAGQAGVTLESTPGSDKARILSAINSLYPGGSTNGAGGIQVAYDIAQSNFIPGGVNRVILATDGDFNVGITSHYSLISLIEDKRRSGITLTTLGVGTGNLKDGMMEQLADKGNGNYFYLDSIREARKVLQTDLVANVDVVAKDVKLQIEFNPAQVSEYRLIGYDNRRLERQDFNNDRIDAGEIGPGHTVTALYELVLAGRDGAGSGIDSLRYQKEASRQQEISNRTLNSELGFLKIRFKAPNQDQSQLVSFPISASHVKSHTADMTQDFQFAAAVSYFGHVLRQSAYRGNYGFEQIAELAKKARGADENGYRQEFIELVKDAAVIARRQGDIDAPVRRDDEFRR